MKIKLLTSLAGESYVHAPGTVLDVSDAEAARHVENGNAEYVREGTADAETATAEARERADLKIARRR